MVIPSVGSTELAKVLQELTGKQADLRGLLYRYTDADPRVQSLRADVNTLETQSVPAIAQALLADIAQREADLEGRISSASRELREIPTRAIEEARLSREVASAVSLFTNLQQRFEEARLAEASSIPDLRVLDAATVPQEPYRNTRLRVFFSALFGSVVLGLAAVLALDRFDRRVRYPEQITGGLRLPILGAVPRVKQGGNGKDTGAAHIVEALRGVRLNVGHAYGAAGPVLLTITSPGPNDGKSFISANLALSFADAGRRTLLIDCDLRRGELHQLFAANRKPGITDFLAGQVEPERLIQRTQYPNLQLVGSGSRMVTAPELLTSDRLPRFLGTAKAKYDVILMDSPPLGASVDPFVLGTLTGNLLLVVRNGITDREVAEAKLDMVDRLPIRLLGVVLNDVRPSGIYRYYSYSYDPTEYEARDEQSVKVATKGLPRGR
jgi:tyrosine-protein kinase Etk/Wzc